mgnify:CR=1 FL=1
MGANGRYGARFTLWEANVINKRNQDQRMLGSRFTLWEALILVAFVDDVDAGARFTLWEALILVAFLMTLLLVPDSLYGKRSWLRSLIRHCWCQIHFMEALILVAFVDTCQIHFMGSVDLGCVR